MNAAIQVTIMLSALIACITIAIAVLKQPTPHKREASQIVALSENPIFLASMQAMRDGKTNRICIVKHCWNKREKGRKCCSNHHNFFDNL